MKSLYANIKKQNTAQSGATTVEFALVFPLFLVLLFGTIEFGRLIYLWNTVQEVSRSAARLAVVTDFNADIAVIQRKALFGADKLPFASEIGIANIQIQYLQADGATEVSSKPISPADNISACLAVGRETECIRFVEVKICTESGCGSVPYVPLIGFFSAKAFELSTLSIPSIPIPISTVKMPAESLGFSPGA